MNEVFGEIPGVKASCQPFRLEWEFLHGWI